MADVPCDGCTLCCRANSFVPLQEGDSAADYKTQQIGGVVGLAWNSRGDCIYVTDKGCSIHGRAPTLCRFYDCRGHFLSQQYPELAALGDPILARGLDLTVKPTDDMLKCRVFARGRDLLRAPVPASDRAQEVE